MTEPRTYRVFFDVKSDRSAAEEFRDNWLEGLSGHPAFRSASRSWDGRLRHFLETDLDPGTLGVTHHEWGVEYVFSFALGVASGVIANVLYALLKAHLDYRPCARDQLFRAATDGDLHVDIEIDTPEGTVRIGLISHGRATVTVSQVELGDIVRRIDREAGHVRHDA